eukprot:9077701-Pyramimonas_sp.AAC.1
MGGRSAISHCGCPKARYQPVRACPARCQYGRESRGWRGSFYRSPFLSCNGPPGGALCARASLCRGQPGSPSLGGLGVPSSEPLGR